MTFPSPPSGRTVEIYLYLAQYPILSTQIRARMRRELFNRGIITPQAFEAEVREKAIQSQKKEGLNDPFFEELADVWEIRLMRVRDHLTDFYFAYNLPITIFEELIRKSLEERGAQTIETGLTFNPELAPQNMLFDQAIAIEQIPAEQRAEADARLQEIKVVLIRTLISDQLAYLKIAKDWFTISDLANIRNNKIGTGKIGGKAAGMLLAARILYEVGDEEIRECLHVPESFYVGADLMYTFMALNSLLHWGDQKYKLEDQIRADFPQIQQDYVQGEFPPDIVEKLSEILERVKNRPIIVRSSSLLEDNFGTSFAGKYESYFCPNQGSDAENLHQLTKTIARIYSSILNPDALLYRRAKGLQDYDERMAILIQVVEGEVFGKYFLPQAAGVAFSRNLYRWSPQIRREDGFVRLVWGLGTRAVDRVGNDYPRLVALSHPLLHPESSSKEIKRYSQQFVDLIDLQDNSFKTLPIGDVLHARYPLLRYVAQVDQGGYLAPVRIMVSDANRDKLVLTFDELLRRTPTARLLTKMLRILEEHYHAPVDTEFTLKIPDPTALKPKICITILQCRPQSRLQEFEARLPKNLLDTDIIFSTRRLAPQGQVEGIEFVIFVSPEGYFSLSSQAARSELGRAIGGVNNALAQDVFICIGPGRWGTINPDLGVQVGYSDIYHTRALVELAGRGIIHAPEASFGTHFFQDLVESNIYPLAIYFDDQDVVFNREFFYHTPNRLAEILPMYGHLDEALRVIRVADYRPNHRLKLIMDDEAGQSVAFLEQL